MYYRGEGKIEANSKSTTIHLPEYVAPFKDFTIQVTPFVDDQEDGDEVLLRKYVTTRVLQEMSISDSGDIKHINKFKVYGEPGSFYWLVHALRHNINVEPNVRDVVVKGDGPYKYIKL